MKQAAFVGLLHLLLGTRASSQQLSASTPLPWYSQGLAFARSARIMEFPGQLPGCCTSGIRRRAPLPFSAPPLRCFERINRMRNDDLQNVAKVLHQTKLMVSSSHAKTTIYKTWRRRYTSALHRRLLAKGVWPKSPQRCAKKSRTSPSYIPTFGQTR